MARLRFSPCMSLFFAGLAVLCLVSPAARAEGKKYAFLVGINKYDHPESLPPLQYAENDVNALADLLRAHGFQIIVLSDASAKKEKNDGLKPTKSNIESKLKEQLKKCDSGDVLLLGLSGHGMYFEEESYFCPQDGSPSLDKKGLQTLIAMKYLYEKIGGCKASKLLLVDACRNDPTRNMGLTDKTTPPPPKNAVALFSCSIGEMSWEIDQFKHGVFFYYVLKGLEGKAKDEEGNITWSSLEIYVRKEVTREAPKLISVEGGKKVDQKPTHVGEESGEPLVIITGNGSPGSTLISDSRATLDIVLSAVDKAVATKNKITQSLQPQIVYVIPGGGGDKMALRKDDVITKVNGHDTPSTTEVLKYLHECTLGSALELQVLRDGEKRTLSGKYETTFSTAEAFKRISEQAKNDSAAQHALAVWYAAGLGTKKDETEAVSWYRKAADKGVVLSQRELGRRYLNGYGVKKDESEALVWYRKAADQGDADSQRNLGWMYEYGLGVQKDVNEAKRWYMKAADQGSSLAQYDIGLMYYNGRFGDPDYKEAARWYRKAADLGLTDAENWLGVLYQKGQGLDKDDAKAVEWYRKAAEKGNIYAQSNLGWMCAEGKGTKQDDKEAVMWYRKSAERGYAQGQFNLGFMYENGRGVEKKIDEAAELYRRASDQGNSQAQFRLGTLYKDGRIGKVDLAEALHLFRKAGDQGMAVAQNAVGEMLQAGQGDKADPVAAAQWYEKAAKQGLSQAQFNLGGCYEKGIGVKQDAKQALDWYKKAAAQGNEQAKTIVTRLEKGLNKPPPDSSSSKGPLTGTSSK